MNTLILIWGIVNIVLTTLFAIGTFFLVEKKKRNMVLSERLILLFFASIIAWSVLVLISTQ